MGQTVVEKIVAAHMTSGPDRPLRAGDFVSVRPRHVMTHDNTAAVLNKFEALGLEAVGDAGQPVFALDHEIGNKSEANLAKYARIEAFAAKHQIAFYPAGSGIGHQMMVENGHVVPGSLVVASDSHSNMYGALGALGTPVVRTDAAAIWATSEFWWSIPRTVQVVLEGELRPGVNGKDVILTLCGLYNQGEVLNAAVEFAGPGVASLSMDSRFTISNMTTEWGALVGWFPVDDVTLDFLAGRRDALLGRSSDFARFSADDLARWRDAPPAPDADATYAARIELDLSAVAPHVAGPDTVQKTAPLPELQRREIAVHKAYLLSCVNGRYEDLAAAAELLEGNKLAEGVELYVAAASREIEDRAKEAGIWTTFEAVGARFLEPGCGPCIGLGEGLLEAGEVGISATNRNFKGRMGSRDAACYLASPQVVAASAIAGTISGAADKTWDSEVPERRFAELPAPTATESEAVTILDGFPRQLSGRLVYLPADNLNTDGIYGKDYTYREDMTREQMAAVVMENYDPGFVDATREGDLVVAGFNFGTGSSREQAVTALQAKGIPLVIAGSFSQTYLRNAFNNGFLCVELPELTRHLGQRFSETQERTLIPGDQLTIDFAAGRVTLGDKTFQFAPLGEVPQGLVVDGGVENQVRKRLGLG
jgi:homoaconitate hydratase